MPGDPGGGHWTGLRVVTARCRMPPSASERGQAGLTWPLVARLAANWASAPGPGGTGDL